MISHSQDWDLHKILIAPGVFFHPPSFVFNIFYFPSSVFHLPSSAFSEPDKKSGLNNAGRWRLNLN
jgi:hypothetical protein